MLRRGEFWRVGRFERVELGEGKHRGRDEAGRAWADGFVSAPAQQQRAQPAQFTLFSAAMLSWLTIAVVLGSDISVGQVLALLAALIILFAVTVGLLSKWASQMRVSQVRAERTRVAQNRVTQQRAALNGETANRGFRRRWLLLLRLRGVVTFLLFVLGVAALLVSQLFVQEQQRNQAVSQISERVKNFPVELVEYPKQKMRAGGDTTNWVTAKTVNDPAGVRVLLWLSGPQPAEWAPGTRLLVTGSVKQLPRASASAFSISVRELSEAVGGGSAHRPPGLLHPVNTAAATLRSRLTVASGSTPGAQLVPGFATGDTSLITADQQQQLLNTSLTHLVAVSGANCALVIVAVTKIFAMMGANRAVRNTTALAALAGFVLLIGPDSSVLRAALMAGVCLVARFGTVGINGTAILGFATTLLLWFDPWQAIKPGFMLSVSATAAILLFTDPIRKRLLRMRVPEIVAMPLSVTVAAQLGCTPFLLLLSDGITVLGLIANLLAAPIAPFATGFALLAMLTLAVVEPLGQLVLVPAAACSNLVLLIANWLSDAAVATKIPWPQGLLGAVTLCAVVLLPLVFGRIRKITQKPSPGLKPRLRTAVESVLIAAAAVLVSINVVVKPNLGAGAAPTDWAVVGCDIGQGDAILIRNTADPGTVMLVDTGDDPGLLQECLDDFGVRRIALLVLSHDDRDHVGALSQVSEITERALIAPRTLGQEERTVVTQLESAGIPYSTGGRAEAGNSGSVGRISWEMLGPGLPFYSSETNEASLIMRVETGELSVLLLGDSSEEGHNRLLWEFAPETFAVDVLKAAHHGSKDASPELTALSHAKYAIVSAGAGNSYGHPAPRSLESYRSSGIVPLRTDLYGHVVVRADENLSNWVEKPPD